jgi:hypothetical protein
VDAKIARPCPYRVNEKDIIGVNVLPIQYRYSGKTEFSALKWETPVLKKTWVIMEGVTGVGSSMMKIVENKRRK